MRIGKYNIAALKTGRFFLDGGAKFGVIPKTIWSRSNPADARNRIELALRILLIRDEKRCIMVDTGIGEGWDTKFSDIYGIDHSAHSLQNSLSQLGPAPQDVTDVVITHLHFDHVGGAVKTNKAGNFEPAFPNASYYIQKRHYECASNPSEKDQASFVKNRFAPLLDQRKLELVEGEVELFPGIFIKLSDGHTIAQQNVLIADEKSALYHPGDMIPTSTHVQLPFIMGYDNYPLVTLEEKKSILRRAVERDWLLFFEHDPNVAASRIMRTEKGFKAGKPVDINEVD